MNNFVTNILLVLFLLGTGAAIGFTYALVIVSTQPTTQCQPNSI